MRLVLVGGLPGTGKSTVAAELAAATGAIVISSDHVRRQLLAGQELTGPIGTYAMGAYAPVGRARVYTEILDRARALLAGYRRRHGDRGIGLARCDKPRHRLATGPQPRLRPFVPGSEANR
ncbi:AAA family ATPase [Nocardia vinacea]|uniref:AAA family ATPase n=1 Tax=Nocardia vinacea TaxID=96468 RepID=UPI00340D8D2E